MINHYSTSEVLLVEKWFPTIKVVKLHFISTSETRLIQPIFLSVCSDFPLVTFLFHRCLHHMCLRRVDYFSQIMVLERLYGLSTPVAYTLNIALVTIKSLNVTENANYNKHCLFL